MADGVEQEQGRSILRGSSGHRGALDELLKLVQQRLPRLFGTLFTEVDEILFEKADSAKNLNEQRIYFDAMRTLRNRSEGLVEKTLATYYQTFNALIKNDLSLQLARSELIDDSLQIVENEALEEMIALDNIVSSSVSACGESLDFLTKRLVFILGQTLSEDDNPFVPESLCEALAAQLRYIQLDLAPKQLIFKQFEKAMVEAWPALVAEANKNLIALGILPELEAQKRKVVKKEAPEQKQEKPSPESVGVAGGEPSANRGREPSAEGRREEPSASGVRESPAPGVREYSASVRGPSTERGDRRQPTDEQLIELYDLLHRALGGDSGAGRGLAPLTAPQAASTITEASLASDSAELHSLLKDQGLESAISHLLASQNHTIDSMDAQDRGIIKVLDKAFSKLNKQNYVPQELANLVLQMQVPVASMALTDPRFLTQPNHPGRRLLNEVFKVSTTFLDGADAETDPLRKEVDEVVERLGQLHLGPRELARLLTQFIDFVEKDKKILTLREQRLLEEEEARAKVSVAHGQVHEKLVKLLEHKVVPVFFKKFSEDAWSKVVFLTLLREGQEPGGWEEKVHRLGELLGLIVDARAPQREQVASLLQGLSAELEAISLEPAAIKRWLNLFNEYFECRVEGKNLPNDHAYEDVEVQELVLSLPGIVYVPTQEEGEVDARALEAVDSLKQGIWVEFRATEDSAPIRCRLAGQVKPISKYVFTNRKGVKVAEQNRNHLANQMKSGNVVVLDNSKLFDSAFEDVVSGLQAGTSGRRADAGKED